MFGIKKENLNKRQILFWVVVCFLCDALCCAVSVYAFGNCWNDSEVKQQPKPTPIVKKVSSVQHHAKPVFVTALGRLEPHGEVIKIGLPGFLRDERIDRVFVHDGDAVSQGQMICSVDNARRLEAKREVALNSVMRAKARVLQVKAGAKQGEIEAQEHRIETVQVERKEGMEAKQAMVAALTTQCAFANREHQRYKNLFAQGAISASQLEDKRTAQALAQGRLLECKADLKKVEDAMNAQTDSAKAELERIKEVRPVDVRLASEDVAVAQADVRAIETDLDLSYIRAPFNGRILKVYAHPGELPGNKGLVEIGKTDQMVAVAEIYQTDIEKVRIGQRAIITGDGFENAVQGSVYSIGWKVGPQRVTSDSPDSANDRRVVEVKILIDKNGNSKVCKLTDMEVDVRINVAS